MLPVMPGLALHVSESVMVPLDMFCGRCCQVVDYRLNLKERPIGSRIQSN